MFSLLLAAFVFVLDQAPALLFDEESLELADTAAAVRLVKCKKRKQLNLQKNALLNQYDNILELALYYFNIEID